jgi:multidrug efflux system outer membrane protein
VQQLALPEVPPGLPSTLLERRPDIRQAEQQLIAANAQIGVAKAAFFPQVLLTGSAQVGASSVNSVTSGPFGLSGLGPSITVPIFNTGRTQAGVDSAEARREAAVLQYGQTIQTALREVSDAIVEYRKRREFRTQQQSLTESQRDAARLAKLRYRGGVTTYLEILDAERQLFTAELGLARAQRDELLTVVQLYKALGGGWQP